LSLPASPSQFRSSHSMGLSRLSFAFGEDLLLTQQTYRLTQAIFPIA
jgi:hypothetical protein